MTHRPPDTLAAAIAWLSTHPDLPPQLRGPGDVARVSARDGGRYPWLRIRTTPAGAGGLQWQTNTELQVELLDDPRAPKQLGDELCLDLLGTCLWLLAELPDAPQPIAGRREVVTLMSSTTGPAAVPDPGAPGQPRWLATVSVNAHPAAEPHEQEV